jgi:hypothetical protein
MAEKCAVRKIPTPLWIPFRTRLRTVHFHILRRSSEDRNGSDWVVQTSLM